MAAGTIIYLNGTSSSGKTSITRALHEQLDQPYLHCPIDLFEMMILERQIERGVFPELNAIESGFTACIAALASAGNNVIVDDVMCEPFGHPEGQTPMTTRELLHQRVSALHMFDILYIKVYCPLPMVEQREQARGNRTIRPALPRTGSSSSCWRAAWWWRSSPRFCPWPGKGWR